MLSQIQDRLKCFSPAERRVAEWVLNNPALAAESTLQYWSDACQVSEPTVVRFCRTAGEESFNTFKMSLTRELARQAVFFHQHIEPTDGGKALVNKLFDSAIASLMQVRDRLNGDDIEQAIHAIHQASRIELYGLGGSGIVAKDGEQKLFRLGKPVSAYSDPHIHRVSASLLDPNSVVIAISHSGETSDLIETIKLARQSGATIIAMTRISSQLSKLANITLNVDIDEDSDVYAPIKSRLAQLSILDVLAIGVACQNPNESQQKLTLASQTLAQFKNKPST